MPYLLRFIKTFFYCCHCFILFLNGSKPLWSLSEYSSLSNWSKSKLCFSRLRLFKKLSAGKILFLTFPGSHIWKALNISISRKFYFTCDPAGNPSRSSAVSSSVSRIKCCTRKWKNNDLTVTPIYMETDQCFYGWLYFRNIKQWMKVIAFYIIGCLFFLNQVQFNYFQKTFTAEHKSKCCCVTHICSHHHPSIHLSIYPFTLCCVYVHAGGVGMGELYLAQLRIFEGYTLWNAQQHVSRLGRPLRIVYKFPQLGNHCQISLNFAEWTCSRWVFFWLVFVFLYFTVELVY